MRAYPAPRVIRALQRVINPSLKSRCTLQSPSTTSDGEGGTTSGYTDVATNVPVRVGYGMQSAYEYLIAEQFQGQMRAVLTFRADQAVSTKQRAYLPSTGRIFQIHGFMDTDENRVSIRAYCTEIQ